MATASEQDEHHYEEYRAGLFALEGAGDSLESSLKLTKDLAKKATGEAKDALLDVVDMLDSSGSTISDVTEDAPTLEEFRKQFNVYDEHRLKAIRAISDAYRETQHSLGTLRDLAANAPVTFKKPLEEVTTETEMASDSMSEAIKHLGGKVPEESDVATESSSPGLNNP